MRINGKHAWGYCSISKRHEWDCTSYIPLGSCVSLFVQMRLFGFTGEAATGPWSMGWSDCLPDAYIALLCAALWFGG